MSSTDGTSQTRIWNSSGKYDLRIYKNGSITYTAADGYIITKVSFTGSKLANLSSSSGTYNNPTWTGSASSVTFTASSTVQVNTAVVTYQVKEASFVAAPVIDIDSRYFDASFTATATCEEGASLYYTLNGEDPTTESTAYTADGITIPTATTTLKVIAVRDGNSSAVASATYTYVSDAYASISALKAEAESGKDYYLKFNDVTVTAKNNSNVYMQDETAGILFFSATDAKNYAAKDVLNGIAKVTYAVYQGKNEITAIDGTLEKTTATKIPCTTVELKALLANMTKYESQRVQIGMAYVTSEFGDGNQATLTDDGENFITLYKATGTSFPYAKKYGYVDVIGYPLVFKESDTSEEVNELQVYGGYITADDYISTVSISKYGYSTFYGSDNFLVPEGMSAYTVTDENGSKLTFNEYASGSTVPAKTGVVVKGTASTKYSLQTSALDVEVPTDNLLYGTTDKDGAITEGPDESATYKYYMLSAKDGKVGFYYGEEDGSEFISAANKAYLAIPSTMSVAQFEAFSFDDLGGNVTGISSAANDAAAPSVAYDLNGRRVNLGAAQKGVYVVNGKKVLVK